MEKLLKEVKRIAVEKFDGHYSIFSFTTNYKGCFGTPEETNYENMKGYKTLESLLKNMIKNVKKHTKRGDFQEMYDQYKKDTEGMFSGNLYLGDGVYVNEFGYITMEED